MIALTRQATQHPRRFLWASALLSLFLVLLVAVPSLTSIPGLQGLRIDTDPENMLAADTPVRQFHDRMKASFNLHDFVVLGVVQEDAEQGVFNPRTLGEIKTLTDFAKTLVWEEEGRPAGVLAQDIIAPSTVDHIEQQSLGSVSFSWLMPKAPSTAEESLQVRDRALSMPSLRGTLVSEDGRALALYIPIREKDDSYRVANRLREKIASLDSEAEYHITGLPVAQDQFGVEMFKQMAISAPAAMVLILGLMWFFFRNLNLVLAPMVVALTSVIGAMGLLVASGQTVHIMSSMIPIFVMPIAVLDAVHILSDFHDRYPRIQDRRRTLIAVMEELWRPMLFTTLTSCAGFASLALTPIPPVQVFGIFVALGVFFAWLGTITLVPAYIMLMPRKALDNFGQGQGRQQGGLTPALGALGRFTGRRWRWILVSLLVFLGLAIQGISQIRINDNPVKWFAPDHEIRVADRALNARFGGTYMAYLTLAPREALTLETLKERLAEAMQDFDNPRARALEAQLPRLAQKAEGAGDFIQKVNAWVDQAGAREPESWMAWDDIALAVSRVAQSSEVFKQPEVLEYLAGLQAHLQAEGLVGKSNSLADIVKTVHRELMAGQADAFRIPDSTRAVAQTLITFENSHKPQDLFKLVSPDYRRANLWLQLPSGDNAEMQQVVDAVKAFMASEQAPLALEHQWFGLTYINLVWQDEMVTGMAKALAGGFVTVTLLMMLLFRSFAWGLMSMVPPCLTIAFIYGVIGLVGKDYDMPIAVLSSLSLGLAVDYAIHFVVRARQLQARMGTWEATRAAVFGEPARAITRNLIIIGAGFTPLLLAPLVPYQTVGIFISAILITAGIATLLGLPALIQWFHQSLFKNHPSATPGGTDHEPA